MIFVNIGIPYIRNWSIRFFYLNKLLSELIRHTWQIKEHWWTWYSSSFDFFFFFPLFSIFNVPPQILIVYSIYDFVEFWWLSFLLIHHENHANIKSFFILKALVVCECTCPRMWYSMVNSFFFHFKSFHCVWVYMPLHLSDIFYLLINS